MFVVPFIELTHDLTEHFFMFQADGQKDGSHWPGMSHVNAGTGMKFSPIKKAIKRLLVFFIQAFAKLLPTSHAPLPKQN
jgi:hypothetical protein